jgi:hypothetical protein
VTTRDLFSDVMRNLGRRKLRTGLTMAGVVIGALAVVLIVSLGNGLSSFIEHHVRGIANPNVVEAWQTKGLRPGKLADSFLGGLGHAPREIQKGNEDDFIGSFQIRFIPSNQVRQLREIEGVREVRPFVFILTRSLEVVGDGREFDTIVSPWIQAGPVKLLGGRRFRNGEDNASECIVSETYLTSLGMQRPEELIGQRVRLRVTEHPMLGIMGSTSIDVPAMERIRESVKILQRPLGDGVDFFKGIGEKVRALYRLVRSLDLKPREGNGTETYEVTVVGVIRKSLLSNIVYVPDGLAEEMGRVLLRNPKLYTPEAFGLAALLQVDDKADIPRIKAEVEKIGLKPRSLEDHLGVMHSIFGMFQKSLVVFGGIAFVVAAFSIVNTLLMSVVERKREIGVLQALGATRRHIGLMFAAEAAAIGFWGGIIGTLVGWLMCQVGNLWASNEWPNILGNLEAFLPPGWLFPVLLVFTTLLGLVAGVYPAWRAARLDPVEALRYE